MLAEMQNKCYQLINSACQILTSQASSIQICSIIGNCYLVKVGRTLILNRRISTKFLGNNEAGYKLADLYLTRGYEPDFRKAADLLRQLSSQMPQAAARLGRLYMDGRGVGGKDYNLAYKYLKQVSLGF